MIDQENVTLSPEEITGYEDLCFYCSALKLFSSGKSREQLRMSQKAQEYAAEIQNAINIFLRNGGTRETVLKVLNNAKIDYSVSSPSDLLEQKKENAKNDEYRLIKPDIDFDLGNSSTNTDLEVSATQANTAVTACIEDQHVIKSVAGQESLGKVVEIDGETYVVKQSTNPPAIAELYYQSQIRNQDILRRHGITQYAPVTLVQLNGQKYLVQRFLPGHKVQNRQLSDQLLSRGVLIRDLKDNVILHRSNDGRNQPVLIDFSMISEITELSQ